MKVANPQRPADPANGQSEIPNLDKPLPFSSIAAGSPHPAPVASGSAAGTSADAFVNSGKVCFRRGRLVQGNGVSQAASAGAAATANPPESVGAAKAARKGGGAASASALPTSDGQFVTEYISVLNPITGQMEQQPQQQLLLATTLASDNS